MTACKGPVSVKSMNVIKALTSKLIDPLVGFVTFDTKTVPATAPVRDSPYNGNKF